MKNLDNISKMKDIDNNDMLSLLSDFFLQCKRIKERVKELEVPKEYKKKDFENVCFTGMGGSAIGAHLLKCYLKNELKLPAAINRDYTIPQFINKDTLAYFCSYSGNTEETLSCFHKAKQKTSNIIIVSSDGKLLEEAKRNNFFYIEIPTGLPPRAALGYSFFPLLMSFSKLGLISSKEEEIEKTIKVLRRMKEEKIGKEVDTDSNIAKQVALKCHRKIPVIYGASDCLEAVVLRWKTQLAENSKMFSTINTLPEMNHNEIVGWEYPEGLEQKFKVIFLRDKCEHPQVSKRIKISKKILQHNNIKTIEINSTGKLLLPRLFSLIYIGDFVSYYLAILNEEDPTPVKRIDYLKEQLAKS